MEKLINYLLQFGHLNQQQVELIKSKAIIKTIKKDEHYQEAGKIPREIIFLTEGIMRIVYYNNKGDEITKYFIDENNFVADVNSYNQGIPSTEYIQAVTDCEYIVFAKRAMEELSMTIIGWDAIIAKITVKALAEKVNRISPMMTEDATERYLMFLNNFPMLVNRIPLSYLASYLGVTQSSLSRVRRNIR
ncbi:cAMP-binding domain of CRP or a regulatory subunit of cAMP-dependent protein kinases [Chitinophaga sp. YR573]|uniref:Crp/Fnr family transcriptional regulator n=1 Tax=Chitinophaga sp. YR573 TaxID=1881040 RepID=UPI0008CF5D12|nr:Crp/Fnr family transcriptional regulator [Chitinophaga sp. YR573]SEW05075.1 cAMP-binding domain of CRP or a regulatory subunit of cAMP-dependent protein kinases [Chitinophaga sp. YR573]